MHDPSILIPVFVLAAWTGFVLLLMGLRRGAAKLPPDAFELGESAIVPPEVRLPNRNYMNLLELPVLFYVVCTLAYVSPLQPALAVPLAWAYVVLRMTHTVIHLSSNKVPHRLLAFLLSNGVLIALWVVTGMALFGTRAG